MITALATTISRHNTALLHMADDARPNPAAVYLASLSAGSRPAALGSLAEIAAMVLGIDKPAGGAMQLELVTGLAWWKFDYGTVAATRSRLAERHNYRTVNKQLSFLRRIIDECWRLGFISAEQRARARDVENVKGGADANAAAAGRALTYGEQMALVGANTDTTAASARNVAILAVALTAGLRRAEIAGLTMADYDADAGRLTVTGKRNKTRIIPIEDAAAPLAAWLTVRGRRPGPLFLRIRRGDLMTSEPITPQAIRVILADMAAAAGVSEFTPHDCRRTFAGDLLDAGADLATVQQLMGHASATTTAGYDRRPEAVRRNAIKRLHFPYQKPAASRKPQAGARA